MSVSRREFLMSIPAFAALVATLPEKAAETMLAEPFRDLAWWAGLGESKWKIVFPDGTVYQFNAVVQAMTTVHDESALQLSHLSGIEVSHSAVPDEIEGPIVEVGGKEMEVHDILPSTPEMERPNFDVLTDDIGDIEDYKLGGLKRMGPISFVVKF